MLKSMTGFGAGDAESSEGRVHVEIKAVNHRFLELSLKSPKLLDPWEDLIRRTVKKRIARGKLEISVFWKNTGDSKPVFVVDEILLGAYAEGMKKLSEISRKLSFPNLAPATIMDLANYPGILTLEENRPCHPEELLLKALTEALSKLDEMRIREGRELEADFVRRLDILAGITGELMELGPNIVEDYRLHLSKVVEEFAKNSIDESRLMQEVALYADKVDYTEEITRLSSHFEQFRRILAEESEPCGRKLDFLLQEINRELNTIGAKCSYAPASRLVIEAKGETEKLREQVQNIS